MGNILRRVWHFSDRLCGLAVRVPGYRARGPGSIPGTNRFSEKQWVWNGVHSAAWVQVSSYLEKILRSRKPRIRPCGSVALTTQHPLPALTSPTSGDRSVGIVRSQTKVTEFVCLYDAFNFVSSRKKRWQNGNPTSSMQSNKQRHYQKYSTEHFLRKWQSTMHIKQGTYLSIWPLMVDSLKAICEPIVWKMWNPWRFTTL
jgi:hypothetical protein